MFPPQALCDLCGTDTCKFYFCAVCAAGGTIFDLCPNCYESDQRVPLSSTGFVPAGHSWSHDMGLFDPTAVGRSWPFVPALNAIVNVPMNASNKDVMDAEMAAGDCSAPPPLAVRCLSHSSRASQASSQATLTRA